MSHKDTIKIIKSEDIIQAGIDFAQDKADEMVVGIFMVERQNGRMRQLMRRLERVLKAKRERKILSGSLDEIRGRLGNGI